MTIAACLSVTGSSRYLHGSAALSDCFSDWQVRNKGGTTEDIPFVLCGRKVFLLFGRCAET